MPKMDYPFMKTYKKSFALLLSILLITAFSFLSIYILEIKTFQSDIQSKQYHQIQAKFHLDFAKDFIMNLELNKPNQPCVDEITVENNQYDIFAQFSYIGTKKDCLHSENIIPNENNSSGAAVVNLYVQSKSSIFKIKLHEKFLKKL